MSATRAFLACLAVLSINLGVRGADWPQFLGPTRNGVSTETGLARAWPKDGPKVLWKKDVGAGWSGPVVAAEKLVIHHRVANDEVVECVNAATGGEIWKASYPTQYRDDFGFDEGPRSTPVIDGQRVFTLGPNGELTAWNMKDGAKLWQRNVNADYKVRNAFFGVGSSPLIADGKLLVNVGAKGASIVAIDPSNGKEVWKVGDDAVSYSSPVLAKVGSEDLAVFFTRDGLLAVTPNKGEIRYAHPWRPRNPNSVNAASPIVVGNQFFISTSYSTGAILLEADKGELNKVWTNDTSLSAHFNTPLYHDGLLFGIDGRQEYGARLCCIEWKTGKVRWTQEKFGCAAVLKADGMGLAWNEGGELVLFELSGDAFTPLARASLLEKPCRAVPAIAGGRFYARDGKQLLCVDLKK